MRSQAARDVWVPEIAWSRQRIRNEPPSRWVKSRLEESSDPLALVLGGNAVNRASNRTPLHAPACSKEV